MFYSTALTTALAALCVHALAAPQQQPFLSTPHLLAHSLSLPAPVHSALTAQLAALPTAHLDQLAHHVHSWPGKRVVRLRANDRREGDVVELTEGDKALLVLAGVKFVDVTDDHDDLVLPFSTAPYPSTLTHNASTLAPLFDTISVPSIKSFLAKFTAFYNRYYRSKTGRESQLFLLEHLKQARPLLHMEE
ncbi:hypothetical protein JCM5296_003043 [Sporobolomyces johnsonii]